MIDLTAASIDFSLVGPEIALMAAAAIALLVGCKKQWESFVPAISMIGLVIGLWLAIGQLGHQGSGFYGMVTCDNFGATFKIIFVATSILALLIARHFLVAKGYDRPEYYSLLLFATSGMMIMANSTDLVVIFLGLEIMSVPLYVMAGFNRKALESNEASIKYFIMGAFASGFLLMGIAFIFGASGTTDLRRIVADFSFIASNYAVFLYSGAALVLIGFAFKVAAVPFHSWVPDVYQGAPTPVTAFFSVGPKAAGFAALLRIFMFGVSDLEVLMKTFWVLAVLTMTVGNIIALRQNNVKRMLAYSSIAHAGYILVALAVGTSEAMSAAIFYLVAYALFNLGAFAVLIMLETRAGGTTDFDQLPGLSKAHPYLCAALALFMFGLSGFPPTVGFFGKFYLFSAAVKSGFIWLAIAGVMNSFVSVYYYFRVLKASYFEQFDGAFHHVSFTPAITIVLILAAIGTLGFGLYPESLMNLSRGALFAFL